MSERDQLPRCARFHNFWQISFDLSSRPPRIQRSTASTFVLVLKDEPDDLTHLAPTAGDACIPLDETAPFFSDMFDDFIIPDNYNALLADELNSLDSSKTTSSCSSNDPFINYRDDSNDICHSPHLLSPGLSKVRKTSGETGGVNDLCPPTQTASRAHKLKSSDNWEFIESSRRNLEEITIFLFPPSEKYARKI